MVVNLFCCANNQLGALRWIPPPAQHPDDLLVPVQAICLIFDWFVLKYFNTDETVYDPQQKAYAIGGICQI
jgi:hypothetical protein